MLFPLLSSYRSLVAAIALLSGNGMVAVMADDSHSAGIQPRHAGHKPNKTPHSFTPPGLTPGYLAKVDLNPNSVNTSTGIASGGVPYSFTMGAAATYRASYGGVVGASSWSDAALAPPNKGRVRSSSWLALDLSVPAEVTVTISSSSTQSDVLSLLPGQFAGGDLEPAFTLYRGWQTAGAEGNLYNNQGAIDWASSLAYLDHEPNAGNASSVEKVFSLSRGKYSIVIGGIASSLEGRQGFTATIQVRSLASPAAIGKVKKRIRSKKSRVKIRGRFINADSAALLAVQQRKKTKTYPARGTSWSAKTKRLKRGTNYAFVAAVSHDGTVSRWKRIKIIRK